MVEDTITDGNRIAELLASEITGRSDLGLDTLSVTDADPEVEATADGARAYDVTREGDDDGPFARVFVHDDRVRIEVRTAADAAADAATGPGLRVRPVAATPPRTVLFVETGAAVKRAADALGAAARAA